MPTIYNAKLDGSDSVRIDRVPLSVFFLEKAYEYAKILSENEPFESFKDEFDISLHCLIFSALFLEAVSNQLAEEVIDDSDIDDFDKCKKRFVKKNKKLSKTAWKLKLIFEMESGDKMRVDDPLIRKLDEVMQLRNTLSHYKPRETARQFFYSPPVIKPGHVAIDLMQAPKDVKPSFIEDNINAKKIIRVYRNAREALIYWYKLIGNEEKVKGLYIKGVGRK